MAGIITRNLSVSGEGNNKHLILRNGSVSRGLAISSNWDELCVAARVRIPATASASGTPEFVMGLGYGLTGWASPINALGFMFNTGSVMTYSAGSGNPLLTSISLGGGVKIKRGASVVHTGSGTATSVGRITANTDRLTTLAFYVHKGGTNLITAMMYGAATPTGLVTLEDIIYGLEQQDFSAFVTHLNTKETGGYALLSQTGVSGVFTTVETLAESTYGGLDSVFIHWDRNNPPLEIADIVVAKWS